MRGSVHYEVNGVEVVATLGDDLTWSVPGDPGRERFLNAAFGPDRTGPQYGQSGSTQLFDLAAHVGGSVRVPDLPPEPPGDVDY